MNFRRVATYGKGIALGVWRFAVPTAAILLSGIILVHLYYVVMPGTWFLRYQTAQVQPSFVDEPVQVRLCRDRLIGSIKADVTRTFYHSDTLNGRYTSMGDYSFNPAIENGERCVDVSITPERFHHTEGYWRFHTDLTFTVNGVEKSTGYDSNTYRIFPRQTDAEKQLQIQQRIDDLQRQLDDIRAASTMNVTNYSIYPTSKTVEVTTSSPPPAESQVATAPAPSQGSEKSEERGLQVLDTLIPKGQLQTLNDVIKGRR